ncbi:elongation factor P maturation arginine rhamnosyltransferase EarP [Undibacterium sp. CY18W]|uniref:Protein-arginine rhamnosyltransferase n=1 Tax=Undibacterium hunanense TaxID=2762292 RepID=A0ABR6ZV95_9BURK|nr:elongation factor P maturation arginine rhamnosyltransferase EarP [Undibacterium hunanense]MBC3919734.1 elongation factor P maturation arginine rhamnosyltransferase EarP [Undibacterium hunanense]
MQSEEQQTPNHKIGQPVKTATTLALFCKVVDNFGDIGICWRLAQQLKREHGIAVTLWVDDLISFRRICPDVAIDQGQQDIANVHVRHWRNQDGMFSASDVADIVIEFFACDIPPGYICAMAECTPRPVWLNLEGLTAEEWVEGCHTLPSPHPSLSLTKHFFFPGFNHKTGGLLRESSLDQDRPAFQASPVEMENFLSGLGVTPAEMAATRISLFCYPHAPVGALFKEWQKNAQAITCLVPEGVATEAVTAFLGQAATVGSTATHGALTVRVLPFIPQADYDRLLWACDLNFVRGEDSFVRAQWANKAFIWHIYPQDKSLHHVKLNAFLKTCSSCTSSLAAFARAWNDASMETVDWSQLWPALQADMHQIADLSTEWQQKMRENGDLASNLLKFVTSVQQARQKDAV